MAKQTVYEMIPQLGKLRDEVLFGDVWEQPELSKRDRSLVTCSVLAALYRTPELEGHLQRAHRLRHALQQPLHAVNRRCEEKKV